MYAACFFEHGEADVIKYTQIPEPSVKSGWKIVKVKACALNHLDIWVRKGIPAYRVSFPHVPGSDISGICDGKEVIVQPGIYCGECEYCKNGLENQCKNYSIIGAKFWGGYAEYVAAPLENIYPKPEHLDFVSAASMPLTFLTSYHMLKKLGDLKGKTILIMGASSGVGVAAIQISKHFGAYVISATSKKEKFDRLKETGSDEVVSSSEVDKLKVDFVFEHTGSVNFERAIKILKPYGKLVTCGATTGQTAAIDIRYLFSRDITIYGARMGTKKEFEEVLELIKRKKIGPLVDKTFELKDAAKAHKYMEEAKQVGKIVLTIP